MLKTLILIVILATGGCGGLQENISTPPLPANPGKEAANMKQNVVDNCGKSNLKERLKNFYSRVPGNFRDVDKDAEFIGELRQCPREETVNSLSTLRESNKTDIEIKAKISYLLIKLDADGKNNKKELLAAHASYRDGSSGNSRFGSDYIIDMISDVILNDDPDGTFLSAAFELETNAATATMLVGTFAAVFDKNPEGFLQSLKEKSKTTRERTYADMCAASSANKLSEKAASIPAGSNSYSTSKEMVQFIRQSKACQ